MPTENLSSGIAVVIDDEIGDDKANINNLISQIEKQNMPCLKYKELPEDSVIDHFEGISFLLLDWKLQADTLGESVSEGVKLPDEFRKAAVKENIKIKTGILDITLYRDDLSQVADNPVHNDSEIDFDVNYAKIIFVDDVLYTGRTVLSAIQAIQKMGKPKSIQLCVLIDRGHHELPFEAEYIGKSVPTSQKEIIKVSFLETDEEENVKILERD